MANSSSSPYFTRFAKRANEAPDLEFTFVALFPEKPKMVDELQELGCRCEWVQYDGGRRKSESLRAAFRLFRLFRERRPDIVHTHLFDDSLPGLLAARLAGVKTRIITKLDAGFHYLYAPRYIALDRFNNWNATTIVTVSGENRRFVLEMEDADSRKITLIHQGVPPQEVTSRSPRIRAELLRRFALEGRKLVLVVARFVDMKGYPEIISAAAVVTRQHPDVKFVCVGSGGDMERVSRDISRAGLQEFITLSDEISREELNDLFGLASVYLHAAISEPFGYTIAEAMLNEVPVVSTAVGAAKDSIRHAANGYLVEPQDADGLAAGICFMLANDTKAIVALARQTAERMFTMDAMWYGHTDLYRKCRTSDSG